MPKISLVPFDPRVVNLSVERDAIRSPSIHLSSIIKDRLITAGIGRKVKGRALTPEEQHLLFQRGFLWERMVREFCDTQEWLEHQLEDRAAKHLALGQAELDVPDSLIRPGECMLDGIYMTPDALHISGCWIEEWKATAMRAKGFSIEDRRPEWIWQAGAYAKVFGMTAAVIRVWHVSDNVISPIRIDWTAEEIDENWKQLCEHWEHMQKRGKP